MRLHHLTLSAFGPFAGTEEVDFDELSDAGLFLLTGPTGAGKTTLLDAVCFALYGSVPGVRGVKALKSQHAPDDVRPEVVLEFSVRDRRFRVRRSPEWRRPKRRGTGFTSENAAATLVELAPGGDERLLSSRAQEVGHFVGELIGMQATQFMQVALLPQGEFQQFLRASSQDRHAVLQHLFRTDRYARIEDWVADHSRALRSESAHLEQAVVRVLDMLADRSGTEVPASLLGDALRVAEAQEDAAAWASSLLEDASTARSTARERQTGAEQALTQARARHDEALRVRELHSRRDQARSTIRDLEAGAATEAESRRLLQEDDRAARCLPLLRLLDGAESRRDAAGRGWAAAAGLLEDTGADVETATTDSLTEQERVTRSTLTRLEALLPRERELVATRIELDRTEEELHAASALLDEATGRVDALPGLLEQQQERLASAATLAASTEPLRLQQAQAEDRLAAAREAESCAELLSGLRDAERDARDRAADARDLVQDLTARRLAGFAAELAGRLRDGDACQVCGSTQHPSPAVAAADQVTDAEQEDATAAHDIASRALVDATGRVAQTEQRLESLRHAAAGLSSEDAAARLTAVRQELRTAEEAQAERDEVEAAVTRLTGEQQELTQKAHELELRRAALAQTAESQRSTITALEAELAAEICSGTSVADHIATVSTRADALGKAGEALGAREAAVAKVVELREHAEQSAHENGFDNLDSARRASLPPEERRQVEELLRTRADAAARAAAVLDDVAVRAVESLDPPDVPGLARALAEAEEHRAVAVRALHQAEETEGALDRLRARLQRAFADWAPVREKYLRADAMSDLVRGMSADNQLQMRLSAYVLATRLDQVVAAANERLSHMRDQRYLLQRTGRATRRRAQAGLGLEVVDQWTGAVREPSTLSGGETFVVSLALALGLADVVTHEAGGTEIETLFVDEGFGTLDADTLDDVMDRLDELRAGGRAVGVVSHVSEMRNRIPTQLHVDKRRNGSVVSVRTAVG